MRVSKIPGPGSEYHLGESFDGVDGLLKVLFAVRAIPLGAFVRT